MSNLDYTKLNKEQYDAVMCTEGPLVITASAGSGKTHTVAYRLAHLIEMGVDASNILMLTFTVKAGNEMRDRAVRLIGNDANKLTVGTYHSFCAQILRKYGYLINVDHNFELLAPANCVDVVEHIMDGKQLKKDEKNPFPTPRVMLEMLTAAINKQKKLGVILEIRYPQFEMYEKEIHSILKEYTIYKRTHNVMDFDDLLTQTSVLFQQHPEICRMISDRYKYIMVDEYQDSNELQMGILKLLRQYENKNICVVGDAGQSIYFWRSANYRNILEFKKMFPGAKEICLKENYRSNQEILDLANAVIGASAVHYNEPMHGQYNAGEQPKFVTLDNEYEEAEYIFREIQKLLDGGVPASEIAVLQRNGNNAGMLEAKLTSAKIPFKKYGGRKFLEMADCQNILALLHMVNGSNVDIFWIRFLKLLPGVGARKAEDIIKVIRTEGYDALLTNPDYQKEPLKTQMKIFVKNMKEAIAKSTPAEAVDFVINDFYDPMMRNALKNSSAKNSMSRFQTMNRVIQQIQFMIELAKKYPSITAMLEDLTLDANDKNEEEECMVISTVHSAKGLEWDCVFIIQATDKNFPSAHEPNSDSAEAWAEYDEEIEEARRLLYVAITRARELLWLTMPNEKIERGKSERQAISRFLATKRIATTYCDLIDKTHPVYDPGFLW